jgi:hypothetical protein
MKAKLNHSQMMALASVFQGFLGYEPTAPDNLQARLIFFHLNATYKQVRRQLLDKKHKYSLTLTEPEALSFMIFFSQVDIEGRDSIETIYNTTLVNNISSAIHKHFSDN